MSAVCEMRDRLLKDGKINPGEVDAIKEFVTADGILDYDDIKFLVGLMKEANYVCDEFDEVLFPCLKHVMLSDGEIGADEQYLLLQMLYSDGEVRPSERRFIAELYAEVDNISPEFQELCENALNSPEKNWSLD